MQERHPEWRSHSYQTKSFGLFRLKKPPPIIDMNGTDTFLDINNAHLRVNSGNVQASTFVLDQINIVTSANTATTVNFNNVTKAFNAASNIEVGTANLFVDTTTSNVGIGTDAPAYTLDVRGTANVGNLYTTSNVGINTNSPQQTLHINGGTLIGGHVLPTQNEQFDLGSAEAKIRHLFLSDNSLWLGDETRVSFTGGKMKFRQRKKGVLPRGLVTIGADAGHNEAATLTGALSHANAHSGVSGVENMKLEHWLAYAKSLDANKEITDVFTDVAGEYESTSVSDAFKEVGDDIFSAHNVAIGKTTAPTSALDVDGTVTATSFSGGGSALTALNAANIASGTLPVSRGGTGTTSSTGTGALVLQNAPAFTGDATFDTNTLKIDAANDRVGVGTTSPDGPLHISKSAPYNGDTGPGILFTRYSNTYGGCIWNESNNSIDGLYFNAVNNVAGAGYGATPKMVINSNGNVGIGTNTPYAKFQVNGQAGSLAASSASSFNTWANGGNYQTHNNFAISEVSIHASHDIVSGSYIASHRSNITASDERIKKDIIDAEDGPALETLRLLKPKRYKYKDVVRRGSEPVWGFIAQEVRETLPYATQLRQDSIPNIYEMVNVSESNVLTFTNFDTSTLESNAMVLKVFDKDDTEHLINIAEVIDDKSLRIEEDLSKWTKLFVYGQRVDDFVFVQKDAIWTVATAALQEVDRQLQAEKEKVRVIDDQLQAEKAKVTTLESQLASVLTRLDALENA